MRPSEPSANWNHVEADDKHTTWRCRGCKALAVTEVNRHPGKCLRCESRSGK